MVLRDDKLEEVATLMEELATALRRLKVNHEEENGHSAEAPSAPPPATAPRDDTIQEGSRVRIIKTLDRYRGRTGVVMSRRGTMFWNLQLDIQGKESSGPLIYKKETSLQAIP